jgi:hypothetical protein
MRNNCAEEKAGDYDAYAAKEMAKKVCAFATFPPYSYQLSCFCGCVICGLLVLVGIPLFRASTTAGRTRAV